MIGRPRRTGFHTVTPYLMVADVEPIVTFLRAAFDAQETHRTTGAAGGIHVEVQIGDSKVMIGGNAATEPQPMALFLYVEDVDAVYQRALAAGATTLMSPEDGMFTETRGAGVKDPFGNDWYIARHG